MNLPQEVIKETNDLLTELANELKSGERLPGDVSAYDLSKATGLHIRRCREILKEKYEAGLLQRIETRTELGNKMFVYRKVIQ